MALMPTRCPPGRRASWRGASAPKSAFSVQTCTEQAAPTAHTRYHPNNASDVWRSIAAAVLLRLWSARLTISYLRRCEHACMCVYVHVFFCTCMCAPESADAKETLMCMHTHTRTPPHNLPPSHARRDSGNFGHTTTPAHKLPPSHARREEWQFGAHNGRPPTNSHLHTRTGRSGSLGRARTGATPTWPSSTAASGPSSASS